MSLPPANQIVLPSVDDIITLYQMQPHPEGGFFAETYRDPLTLSKSALPARFNGDRSASTAIMFLLPQGVSSNFHRIAADEVWHFYLGDPIEIVTLTAEGVCTETTLGTDILNAQVPQLKVPAGVWFGAHSSIDRGQTGYTLVGCTVAPGFDFEDFELANRATMLKEYPHAQPWIERLTPA